ncbi:MAG: DUF4810 domain-containing protein [Oleibacter sp.]|nr:DUF4810 domain-containing protein [Thalassolituus sp.]
MRSIILLATALSVVVLSGCASKKDIFYWGEYESLVYSMYAKPGSADAPKQISILTTDIQKAEAKDMPIAPGIHAHLGYMYALQGDIEQSKSAFLVEKNLYPESATMIDGMLQRLEGSK